MSALFLTNPILYGKMNIGFDGSYAILKNNTTEGNYSKTVVDSIAECYPRHRIFVYTPSVNNRSTATSLAVQPNVTIKQPRHSLSKTLWLHWKGMVKELQRHHIDVYHGLCGRLPLRIGACRSRSVVTIHGLSYVKYAQDYKWWSRTKQKFFATRACGDADAIVATSQIVKDDLTELMGVDPGRVHVIYPAVDKRFFTRMVEAELDAVSDKYKLPKHYILVISSMLEHKNVLAVLRALKQMRNQDTQLVMVGSPTRYYAKVLRPYIDSNNLSQRVLHISRVHANDMASIYRLADVLVAPSRYEGFGLTVIEAQACDVPVITTTGTAQQEAAGDAALFFEPDDVPALVAHLDRVLDDEPLREQLIEAGRRNIERFTDQQLANNLDTLYHQLLR